jgi:hypothetical protein
MPPIDVAGDVRAFMTDSSAFGLSIVVTSPGGTSVDMTGYAREIGQTIEPETGQAVAGMRASIDLPLADFRAAFGSSSLPVHVASAAGAPWRVSFDDAGGVNRAYKVVDTMPDLSLGVITCTLETYRP